MKLFIITIPRDYSAPRISQEAEKKHIATSILYYADLTIYDGVLYNKSEKVRIAKSDRIILRLPFNSPYYTKDYSVFVKHILMWHPDQIALDRECFKNHCPYHEDKLYQLFVYQSVHVPTPQTWYFQKQRDIDWEIVSFPFVLKKRFAGRSKDNYLIEHREDLKKLLRGKSLSPYILQKYIKPVHDFRVYMLDKKAICIMKRNTYIRDKKRLSVKGGIKFNTYDKNIIQHSRKIVEYLRADLVGLDIVQDADGRYFFIDINLTPLLRLGERDGNVNIAGKIVAFILKNARYERMKHL